MLLADKYPFLTNYFTDVLTKNITPLPQSIIFYGSDVNIQYQFALDIARLLNCNKDKADDCDCLNCKWIRENAHPAVLTISKVDNKEEDDETKTNISVRQIRHIKNMLVNTSEFHRVFILCDKDKNGNLAGLNSYNFKDESANSMLKIIEEPQEGVTFIFLTRYLNDVLPTIISRSQCFYIPAIQQYDYDYSIVSDVIENYWEIKRKNLFDLSLKLQKLAVENDIDDILTAIQNYIFITLKANPKSVQLIKHIEVLEKCKKQALLGIKSANIFDYLCLELIKN